MWSSSRSWRGSQGPRLPSSSTCTRCGTDSARHRWGGGCEFGVLEYMCVVMFLLLVVMGLSGAALLLPCWATSATA